MSTRKKKQPILNDMGQLHYMLTESMMSILVSNLLLDLCGAIM